MELAARDLALRVIDASAAVARRPELAQERRARLEGVRAGCHVDRLREARVRNRAVVALEVVLDAHLPVGRVLRLGALVEHEAVEVDAVGGEQCRQLAEVVGERCHVRVGVDEDEWAPGVHLHRHQSEAVGVEPGLAVGARCRDQRAVEPVGPRVIGALDRLPPPGPLADDGATVPAHVEESPQLRLLVPDDHDR